MPREKYIIWRVNDELNNIYSINNERLRIINSYFHSIRSSLKINESFYFSKNFFIMEPEGKTSHHQIKENIEKKTKTNLNLVNEEEIGEEYPFNNFKFINDNSLSLDYKNSFEGIN